MALSNQGFVLGLYRELLQRSPLADESAFYVSRLDSGFFTRPQVAQMFFAAPEYKGGLESVARLYWASFNRAPDYEGLLFWNSIVRNGARLEDVATIFSYSPEFAERYGANTSNDVFVNVLYSNALGRSPDAAGESYWLKALAGGASRGQVLNAFAQSAELAGKLVAQTRAVAAYAVLSERSPSATEIASLPGNFDDLLVKAAASAGALVAWSGDGVQESPLNDGSVSGALLIKLSGDAFKGAVGAKLGAVANVPKGLTASLLKVSDSEAKLSFSGKAAAHDAASSIANLSVTFTSADFVSGKVPSGASRGDFKLDFTDMLLYVNDALLTAAIRPNLTLSVDLTTDSLKLGSAAVIPIGGVMAAVTDVDFSGIPPSVTTTASGAASTTTKLIVFKGGAEANRYTASPLGDQITGGGGADVLTLGVGSDTLILPALAAGVAEIYGFALGKGGDVLRVSPFLASTKTGNLGVIDTNLPPPATLKAWGNGDVLLTIGSGSLSAGEVAALFGTYLAVPTTARKAVLLSADVTGDTKLWYVTNSSGAGVGEVVEAEVEQVATLVGVNNLELAGFAASNFA